MSEKPGEPKVGSHKRKESRPEDLTYARRMVVDILRTFPQNGPEAVASLEGWLKKFPELQPMVAQHFDLCTHTENVWIGRLSTGSVAKHVIRQEIDAIKSELIGEAPTGLMRILASTVAVAHMAYQMGARAAATSQTTTPAEAMALDRHAESVQKRLFQSIEFLDTFLGRKKGTAAAAAAKLEDGGAATEKVPPETPQVPDTPLAPGYPKLAD